MKNNSKKLLSLKFLEKMERELENNQGKGNWKDWQPSVDILNSELLWHYSKLLKAVERCRPDEVSEHAADVANYAMKFDDLFGEKN